MRLTAVLKTNLYADELVGTIDDILFSATETGTIPFRYVESVLETPDVDVHIWQGPYETDQIKIIEDKVIDCVYCVFTCDDENICHDNMNSIIQKIGKFDYQEIIKIINNTNNYNKIIELVLYDSKNYNNEVEEFIANCIDSKITEERSNAVQAASMLNWPTLNDKLKEAYAKETDASILNVLKFAVG